jgi:hypothetical protein
VKPGKDRDALTAMLQKEGYVPVWLEPQLLDLYYNGFCNSVLWQLFHYVPLNMDGWQRMTEHHTMQMQWQVGGPVRLQGGAGRGSGGGGGGGGGRATAPGQAGAPVSGSVLSPLKR